MGRSTESRFKLLQKHGSVPEKKDIGWWLDSHLLVSPLLLDPRQGLDHSNAPGAEGEGMSMLHLREGHKGPYCSIVASP